MFILLRTALLVPELVTQREPGDLSVIRNAGNIVPPHALSRGGVSASVGTRRRRPAQGDIVDSCISRSGGDDRDARPAVLDYTFAVAGWLRR